MLRVYRLLIISLFFTGCFLIEDKNPIISIIQPSSGSVFVSGDIIQIKVDSSDPDGNIEEIRFYANDVGLGSDQIWPYEYDWNTHGYEVGSYSIKAEAIDDDNQTSHVSNAIIIRENLAPQIDSLTADPSFIALEGTSIITCTATDADSDTLIYEWECTEGSIDGSGSSVAYTASSTEETHTITCTVSDWNGEEDTETVNVFVLEMIFVEGGTFTMGDIWGDGDSDERPTHEVTLSDFCIGKHEVTQALYQEVMGVNPSSFIGDNLPVQYITWYDAVNFCNNLSETSGLQKVYTISGTDITTDFNKNGYRLPTEAEWEYAARSGGRNDRKWSGTNTESELGNYAWYSSNSSSTAHEIGTKQANELGLYDMSGNVQEWCWDWYGDYLASSQINPSGPSTGSDRVLRGGRWSGNTVSCRVTYRFDYGPSYSRSNIGFRLALSSGS